MRTYIETATEALLFLQQNHFDIAAKALSAAQCAAGVPDTPDQLRRLAQQAGQIADLIETEEVAAALHIPDYADAFHYRDAKAQAAAWFKVTAVLSLHNKDTFSAPGTGEECAVKEILRLQKCEMELAALRKGFSDMLAVRS